MTAGIEHLLQPHLERGLELWLEGEALRFKAPKELMTQDLVAVLKANKPAILAWLKTQAEDSDANHAPELQDEYPLAYTQGAIWMLYKFAPNSPAYNTTFACTLAEGIDEAAVKQAFHALMVRHPVLRSTFTDTDLGPRQRVWSHLPMPLQFVDGRQWDQQELQQQLEQEADAPFDLHHESCLRVKLFRNTVQGDILMATIQHVGADLWALLIVAQDIKQYYQEAARGQALSVQPVSARYREHVEWQQHFLESARGKQERFYWQQQLTGAPLAISLPEDKPRPPLLQLQAKTFTQRVDPEQYRRIKQFCKHNSITPFVFVQAAFQLLVHQRTSAQDFLVGTPTMGRSRKGMDQVVGDFANPVVLRARVRPEASLQSLFSQVKKTLLAAMEYQECPFPIVVQDCNPPRDSSRTPLFQLMFVWHQGNADMMPKDGFIKDILPMSGPRGAPYDVMLAVSDLGDHFEMNWTYQTSLYQAETVEGFARQVLDLMARSLETPAETRIQQFLDSPANAAEQALVEQVQQTLAQQLPQLAQYDYQVLVDRTPAGEWFRRLMLVSSAETAQSMLPDLLQLVDDVVCLPALPYTVSGAVDTWALRQQTALDQRYLATLLEQAGGSAADLLIGRQRELLPTFSQGQLKQTAAPKALVSPLSQVNLDARPDAWMQGQAFAPQAGAAQGEAPDVPTHLFAALQQTAAAFPQKGFVFVAENGAEQLYTYAQLEQDAHVAATGLLQSGLNAGDILLLQMRFDQRFFAVWWGAVLLGVRPLVVATPEHYHERNGVAQKLYNVAHNYTGLIVAADRTRVADTQGWLGDGKTVIDADRLLEHGEPMPTPAFQSDPVAFLQLTSGSTGTPKAIQITHQGVLHHVASSARFNGYSAEDVSLNWLPFDHVVPILTTHLKDVVLGIQQIQLPTAAVLSDPLLWLKALSRYRVNFSWAPNFAYQRVLDALALSEEALELDLRCVKILMNAGEQVLAPVVQGFQAALAPYGLHEDAVQPAFGMAEACTCMTYNNHASQSLSVHFRPTEDPSVVDVVSDPILGQGFVDLGPVIPGVEVRITDQNNQLLKEGVIGRMQIRGPVVTPGYLNNPEANAEAFVGDGWFNSGDLGFIWNGHLILTGREKEMIVVNGANYYCFELEQVAARVSGVKPTFVAATGVSLEQGANSDVLVLFYVAEPEADRTALERQIAARVGESFSVVPRFVIEVSQDHFHKTTSGKIQRGQFKKLFEADYYQAAVQDYVERHRTDPSRVDTLFAFQRRVRKIQTVQQEYECLTLSEVKRLEVERLEAKETADQHATPLLLNLGALDLDLDLQQPEGGLLAFAQLLAESLPQLMALRAHTALAIWLQTPHQEALALIKPLLETLRQETGLEQLACVLTPGLDRPNYPQPGSIVWQQSAQEVSIGLVNVAQNPVPNEPIVRRGTYLISGGLGGLAQTLCDYLIRVRKAQVILAGRQPLAGDSRRLSRFNQLRARFGEQVHYVCLPDWQLQSLTDNLDAALAAIDSKRLDGVFHLAGVMGMAPLEGLTDEHWHTVMQPKAEGTRALAEYLKAHWPDSILVQFGSVNGFFGGQSAAAYSAANALQSQITETLNRTTSIRSWCLNWSVWQGAGMARQFSTADLHMARNKGFLPLSLEQDAGLIARALQMPPDNYCIGLDPGNAEIHKQVVSWERSREIIDVLVDAHALDGPALVNSQGQDRSASQRAQLQTKLQALTPALMDHAHTPQWNIQVSSEPLARNAQGMIRPDQLLVLRAQAEDQGEAPATETEQQLAAIWSDVLGRPVTDVTRTFFEYGGHSINATQVVSAINNRLGLPITVANLFQFPTIRELAQLATGDDAQAHTQRLSLILPDCIARGDDYRLDAINPDVESAQRLVFLPTALGIPSAYGQMAGALAGLQAFAATVPMLDKGHTEISAMARGLIGLLEENGLLHPQTMLVGWSMAGVLGYEILAQLQLQRKPLPRLVMLDSGFADGLHEITFDPAFQRLMFAVELGLTPQHFADFNQQPDDNTKLQWLKQYLPTIGIEVSEEMLIEWWRAYHKRLKSLLTYKIDGELADGDIHLFKADLHTHGRSDLGWNDNNNRIKWTLIQADHQGIVKQPETFRRIQELLA
ncbi:MAG: SDR family NAD(P)-dependent oxidoreductase [Pseudomonadota bacterium]|nr:SDR family NAD(P)-dependent oxidoreductase [Pseudomonadota bacterium]